MESETQDSIRYQISIDIDILDRSSRLQQQEKTECSINLKL